MSWDSRFASIVKETEQSIARVKSQLQAPLRSRAAPTNYSGRLNSSPYNASILKPTQEREHVSHRRRSVSFDLGSSLQGQRSTNESGGLVISLLTARIKDQQKEITALQDSHSTQQRALSDQERQLNALNAELRQLQSRPTSSVSESQLIQFKTDMKKELNELRGRLTASRGSNSPESSTLAHELHSSKKLLRGEIDIIQEDVSSLKSRLRSHGSDVGLVGSSLRDIERKQERLAKAVSRLQEWRQIEEGSQHSVRDCSTQLRRTRQVMSEIQSRLRLLEAQSRRGPAVDPPSTGATFSLNNSNSGSSPLSKSSCLSGTLFSSLRGSSNNRGSRTEPSAVSRPTTSRVNPLHATSPLWVDGTGECMSDSEDTLDGISILSSESGDLNQYVLDDLSPSSSLLSVGAL